MRRKQKELDDVFGEGWYAKAASRFSVAEEKRQREATRPPRRGAIMARRRPANSARIEERERLEAERARRLSRVLDLLHPKDVAW